MREASPKLWLAFKTLIGPKRIFILTGPWCNSEMNRRYTELIGPPFVTNLSTLMSGFTQFFFSQKNEFNDSEKPDSLRFVREAKIEHFRNGLITPRIRVRTLYKGAWKEKGLSLIHI